MEKDSGILYLIAGPIGNLEDITYRAIRILGEIEVLACEDTRETRKILDRYALAFPKQMISYHEHNEARAGDTIMRLLEDGKNCALITDAGFPGISDPGYRIVAACVENDVEVQVLPGPSAVSTALVVSGLPSSSFTFKGFPPRKTGERKRFLEMDKELPHTLVFFESPHRIGSFLADALDVLGDRSAAVCIELTKKFERVRRGYLSELAAEYVDKTERGEITIVIVGNNKKFIRKENA
jgi:16S rRNA (cytidine1402-2'-O)-methyltransferase